MSTARKNPAYKPVPTRLYRTHELATLFGVDPRTIRRWLSTGYLASVVLRNARWVTEAEVQRLLADAERGKA